MSDSKRRIRKNIVKGNQTIKAYQRLFETEDGKLVLQDMLRSSHVMTTTMNENSHELAYNEGSRSVVLRILKTINTNADIMLNHFDAHYSEDLDEDTI